MKQQVPPEDKILALFVPHPFESDPSDPARCKKCASTEDDWTVHHEALWRPVKNLEEERKP